MRKLRLLLYWGLPPLLLYVIFSRIDVHRLLEVAATANLLLILVGAAFNFVTISVGAVRWHWLARSYQCTLLPLRSSIREYWLSLTYGVIVPGSLGSDAYRVALSGRQTGRYLRGAFVIGIEKIAALLSCALLIVGLYPMIRLESLPDVIGIALDVAHWALVVGLGALVLTWLLRQTPSAHRPIDFLATYLARFAARVEARVAGQQPGPQTLDERTPLALLLSAFSWSVFLPTFGLSVVIHVIAAISNQFYFQALGYDLPLLLNLFVAPLIMLVFTLPVSFGGIGIREVVFIVFYGAFGVPAETALLVSFCSLFGVLIGHACGVVLIYSRRQRPDASLMPVEPPARRKQSS